METITVQTSTNQYDVSIGKKLRFETANFIKKDYSSIFIITDSNVESLYLQDVLSSLKPNYTVNYTIVPAGESSKSIRVYFDIMTQAIQYGLDRHGLIIALGGGMVGDLSGFVSSTFMRGIDYIQIPTTILAHDSSVGGKVAINHPEGKNLIGSFHPPQAVIYDVETLHTIPLTEIRSGYAEIAKHSLIHTEPFWDQIKVVNLKTLLSDEDLMVHLLKGIEVKAAIVEKDERESNIRQHLNFGHTLGHALEAELGYGEITHGEGVGIGMLFAMRVSEFYYDIKLPYTELFTWLKKNDFPLDLPQLQIGKLINRMKKDKKARNKTVQMVLLKSVGQPAIELVDDNNLAMLLEKFLRELVEK
ncbi:3-dehydroquinate synthase [Paraliobacillus quinghaiensis]|uniref:3-dehydroquinate synthase n=1 Tax=Paraliobacillus quinghaiensis TaxID=470815 RepID=A0A917WR93_9BACI|nr:3-dehydroquinate synthase [Paraliobacillus quinghaiensis]GGM22873.1 3-dehydroquinate synthase [Paraliobacillus quinghaiensis]